MATSGRGAESSLGGGYGLPLGPVYSLSYVARAMHTNTRIKKQFDRVIQIIALMRGCAPEDLEDTPVAIEIHDLFLEALMEGAEEPPTDRIPTIILEGLIKDTRKG